MSIDLELVRLAPGALDVHPLQQRLFHLQPESPARAGRESGFEWTDVQLSFMKSEHIAPAYLKLNPNGTVPTLQAR